MPDLQSALEIRSRIDELLREQSALQLRLAQIQVELAELMGRMVAAAQREEETRTLTLQEAADALGVSYHMVWRMANAGAIRTIRIGSAIRVPISALKEVQEMKGALNGASRRASGG
ncbi:hypothetical protein CSW30_03150 [Thermus scotoductus]|uniref:Helix-turn-helix domain-containing protein n=1 Tax=Thermus scotoductus TaxID=37636 RepID=A0A430URR3_THESC|nr:helix-turn-helix domain-containing protein [Thermus scotoductus]RTI10969.1 hypothetical protein CSW30_03150 [Thermus scotoductus]